MLLCCRGGHSGRVLGTSNRASDSVWSVRNRGGHSGRVLGTPDCVRSVDRDTDPLQPSGKNEGGQTAQRQQLFVPLLLFDDRRHASILRIGCGKDHAKREVFVAKYDDASVSVISDSSNSLVAIIPRRDDARGLDNDQQKCVESA
jgi:hypothetical protein